MTNINLDLCLCGSGLQYAACCAPIHNGELTALTASALMRSRFTAYALGNADYLLASWEATTRPKTLDFLPDQLVWQRLVIINSKKGQAHDNKGVVEFKAYYRQHEQEYFLHEISRFVKHGQLWFYLDGVIKADGKLNPSADLGRNEPCYCGSGKKFKHCCG